MKILSTDESHLVGLLAAFNLSLVGLRHFVEWVQWLQPVFSALVPIGQFAVAIATVVFIVRKIHLLKNKNE